MRRSRDREVVGRCRAYRDSDKVGSQECHPSPGVQPAGHRIRDPTPRSLRDSGYRVFGRRGIGRSTRWIRTTPPGVARRGRQRFRVVASGLDAVNGPNQQHHHAADPEVVTTNNLRICAEGAIE